MIWCEPSYIEQFRCTADSCTDTCCAGWEIVLDEEALERYGSVQGSFGRRLQREIKRDGDEAYFGLTKHNRCPFLDEHNLCEIYRELGEEALCDICTEHPRFYNWVGEYTEKGLGLCCEEAERLLFAEKEPLTFTVHRDGEEEVSEDLKVLLQIRGEAFAILQDRSRPFAGRTAAFKAYMEKVQQALDGTDAVEDIPEKQTEMSPERAHELLTFFAGLDCLDKRWMQLLRAAEDKREEILTTGFAALERMEDRTYEWEHLAVYLLFRYLTEAVYDGEVLLRCRLVCVCLELTALLAGYMALTEGYTEEARDRLLRIFSREIEYCPENMEALYEAIRENTI